MSWRASLSKGRLLLYDMFATWFVVLVPFAIRSSLERKKPDERIPAYTFLRKLIFSTEVIKLRLPAIVVTGRLIFDF